MNDNERFLNDITKEEEQMIVINTGKALAFEDGLSKGEKKQKIEIAKEMLLEKMEISFISKITKLSIEEIEQIKSTLS